MHIEPEENSSFENSLAEQFRSKGYDCKELKEDESTVLIITHSNKKEEGAEQFTAVKPPIDAVNAAAKA